MTDIQTGRQRKLAIARDAAQWRSDAVAMLRRNPGGMSAAWFDMRLLQPLVRSGMVVVEKPKPRDKLTWIVRLAGATSWQGQTGGQ